MDRFFYDNMTDRQRYDFLNDLNPGDFIDDNEPVNIGTAGELANVDFESLPYPWQNAILDSPIGD